MSARASTILSARETSRDEVSKLLSFQPVPHIDRDARLRRQTPYAIILSAVESGTQLDDRTATREELSMTRPMWVKHSSAVIAALALVLVAPAGRAQQLPSSSPPTPLDKPQVLRTAAATIR